MKFKQGDRVWFVAGGSGNATVKTSGDFGIQVEWDYSPHNPDDTLWPEEDFDFLTKEPSKDANPLR